MRSVRSVTYVSGPDLGGLEARVGFEPLRPIDPMQLTDSNTRQKRQKG